MADVLRATAMKLRLLHTLRRPDIAMPLTSAQLTHLSVRGVIVRLATVRNHHMLALKLCTFFWRLARDKTCVRVVARLRGVHLLWKACAAPRFHSHSLCLPRPSALPPSLALPLKIRNGEARSPPGLGGEEDPQRDVQDDHR